MLVLASQSFGRRSVLTNAGVPYEALTADIDEVAARDNLRGKGLGPAELAAALAELKALQVSDKRPDDFIIGCDQTLALENGTMIDKPADRLALVEQLKVLSGNGHTLFSAIAIARGHKIIWRHVEPVILRMRPLSDAFIEDYVEREGDALLGCVGGYRIEARGAQLFSKIDGSHFAIIGLPLLPLLDYLRSQGVLAS
jgi:septum formation protein